MRMFTKYEKKKRSYILNWPATVAAEDFVKGLKFLLSAQSRDYRSISLVVKNDKNNKNCIDNKNVPES